MPPLNVNVRGNTHPFLNFAYKLTPNSRATLLLRFRRNWKVYTCAVQLTHATPANGVTAHPTCIDLRSQIITDGEWHDISFNWRSLLTSEKHGDINSLFPNMQTSVLLMNVAIGAQVYLSSCPSNQDRADTHAEGSGVLAGEMWIDAVSLTKTQYIYNRQKRTQAQMAGMVEGKSAVTHISVETETSSDKKKDQLVIKLYRTDKCVTSEDPSVPLVDFNPVLTVPYRKKRMLPKPSMVFSPRHTTSSRGDGGTIAFVYDGSSHTISNGKNIASAISNALVTVMWKVSSKSIVVQKTFD